MSKISDKMKQMKNNLIASSAASIISKKLDKFLKGIPKLGTLNDMVVMAESEQGKTTIHIVELMREKDGTVFVVRVAASYKLDELVKHILQIVTVAGMDPGNLINQNINIEENEHIN